jgi:hypothetical protein
VGVDDSTNSYLALDKDSNESITIQDDDISVKMSNKTRGQYDERNLPPDAQLDTDPKSPLIRNLDDSGPQTSSF